jgi:hypothetical protein
LDWDQGYRGQVTNFIVHHFAGSSGDPRGIEGDNFRDNNDVQPRSAPEVTLGTIVASGAGSSDQGIVLRRGSWGFLSGLVVSGFAEAGIDLRDGAWAQAGGWPDGVVAEDSCFSGNNPNFIEDVDCGPEANEGATDCNDFSEAGGADPTDEANYFPENTNMPLQGNIEADPDLGDISGALDGSSAPDYSVGNGDCAGAFAPSGTDWTAGWTAFPAD